MVIKKILIGMASGCLGILLIHQGFLYDESIRIDFRVFSLVLLGFYRLKYSLFISATVISIYRFTFGIDFQSIMACFGIFVIAIGMLFIYRFSRWKERPILFGLQLNGWAIFIVAMTIYTNSYFSSTALPVIGTVSLISSFFGVLITIISLDLRLVDRKIDEYRHSAETDHLTGLSNRRQWEIELLRISREQTRYNVLFLDIDHFKSINDTYGHSNGDEVLKQFSELLIEQTREQDIKARIGGEEFAILIPYLSRDEIVNVSERIRQSITDASFVLLDQKEIRISASIGIANGNSKDIRTLVEQADQNLYQAKERGRNRCYLDITV